MYAAVHGTWCHTKTFPTTCKICGVDVFYFQCDCDSRVFFDELGPPWPIHDCLDNSEPSAPRPSSDAYFKSTQGVTLTVQGKDDGLLSGMTRFNGSIDSDIIHRVKESQSSTRNTSAIPPYSGGKSETHTGVVTHTSEISLESKFGIAPDSVGARAISRKLGGLRVTQITIQVDEIAADAEDYLSYTFWCKPGLVPKTLARHSVISATIAPTDIMGIPDTRWVAGSLEVLL